MAKLVLDPIANAGTSGIAKINSNFDKIETAIENTLSRDGSIPNQMNADLDMNHNDILNVTAIEADDFLFDGESIIGRIEDALQAADEAEISAQIAQSAADEAVLVVASVIAPKVTVAQAIADDPDTDPEYYDIMYYDTSYVRGSGAKYKKIGSDPGHDASFQNANGTWYEIDEPVISPVMLGAKGDGVTDDSSILTATFSVGIPIVDGGSRNYKVNNSIIQPSGTKFQNFTLTAGTPGMNILRVNNDCKVFGTIVGTGTTGIIERGIYPAVDSVVNVELNVVVKNITVGVQGETVSGGVNQATSPARWYGNIHCEDIVGVAGNSEGYGVLGTFKSCQFNITGKNIRRHLYYLAAGAIDNVAYVDGDGCGNYLVQINTFSGQPASQRNTIYIKSRNLTEDVAGQSGPCAIVGQSHRNTIVLDCVGNGNDNYAVFIQGTSGGPYPTNNKIINSSIQGTFKGSSVIRLENTDGTIVQGNAIDASATSEVIGIRYSGTLSCWSGGYIVDNTINAQGANNVGVYVEITQASTYIGPNRILNNGTSLRVNDQTGGKRVGFSRSVQFSGTTPSITANNSQDIIITLSEPVTTFRSATSVVMTGASASYFENAWVGLAGSRADPNTVTIRGFNGGAGSKTLNFVGVVYGD